MSIQESHAVPCTADGVREYDAVLKGRKPAYPGQVTGLLFPSNYAWSLPVGVHYNLGVNVNEALVDDLWVHAWVQHVGPPNVVDLSEGAHVVSYLNGHRLFDPYTVFYTAPNHALSEEKTHCGEVVPWRIKFRGNILVVKHDYDMVPMSITTEERGRVRDVVFAIIFSKAEHPERPVQGE
ncbi:hypothetical protein DFH06DRAFT_1336896 [Mycena polygramma]|nr:hypothetical protein DFH06DRAFT_1336896 [Mycena polygramma]